MKPLRTQMQMIFQDPYSSLNPRHTIGSIIAASYEIQKITPDQGVKRAVQELMERVGLNPEHYNRYPHEFSGGQRRVPNANSVERIKYLLHRHELSVENNFSL